MVIRHMNYSDFLNRPDIKREFDTVFELKKNMFKKQVAGNGLDDGHLEIYSIKVASVETDFYFTDLHKEEIKKAG